jgi:hypothetical protein
MRNWVVMVMLASWSAAAQTQIDLRTQAKSVDFSGANSTKTLKTGTALPSTCVLGEVFFNTSAPAGANLYACTAANTWSVQGTTGTAGALQVENYGSMVGARGTLNVIPGAGLTTVMTDTGSQINVQLALDSAVEETQPNEQSGAALLCSSSGGQSSNYQCAMSPTLDSYGSGMLLHWIPDVNGAGGATTLNIDTLGAVPVKMPDGVTNPSSTDIAGGRLYSIWYDGASFRMASSQASFSYTPENVSNKGALGGYAPLGAGTTTVPLANLPTIPYSQMSGVQPSLGYTPENVANKGQANGYAGLDVTGKVPALQLPATTPLAMQSANLTFTPIFDGACQDQTFTFSGVSSSTQLVAGLPSNLPAGVDAIMFANAANSVDVRLCNHSGVTQNMGAYTFSAKTPSYVLTASAALTFSPIADGACGSRTLTLAGANAGDPVAAGFPAGMGAGLTGNMTVSSGNTVSVLLCNYSGAAWNGAAQTFVATIVK